MTDMIIYLAKNTLTRPALYIKPIFSYFLAFKVPKSLQHKYED